MNWQPHELTTTLLTWISHNLKTGNRLKGELLFVPNTDRRNFLYRGHRNWGITHFITGGLVASKKVFNHNLWRSDSRSLLRTESCEWSQLAIPPNPSLSLWFPSILSILYNFQNVFFQIAKRICPNSTFYLCLEWSQLTIPLSASLPLWFLTEHSSRVIMFPL